MTTEGPEHFSTTPTATSQENTASRHSVISQGGCATLVNRVRRHERLWCGPKRDWHVVTSGLDLVQDTAWALETYAAEVDNLNEDRAHAYIRIFGVLNGLVIQQDAAFQLFRGVGAPKAAVEFTTSARGPLRFLH